MADFNLKNATISYEGGDSALAEFEKELKGKKSGAVLKALEYVDEYSLVIDYKARSITDPDCNILNNGGGEMPLASYEGDLWCDEEFLVDGKDFFTGR
jgi:hypothetical protein